MSLTLKRDADYYCWAGCLRAFDDRGSGRRCGGLGELLAAFASAIPRRLMSMHGFADNGTPVQIYQIKVTLRDSQPPIWRHIQVSSDTTRDPRHIGVGFTCSYEKTGVRSHELIPQDISGRSTPSAAKSSPGTAFVRVCFECDPRDHAEANYLIAKEKPEFVL